VQVLKPGGVVTLVAYIGHAGGMEEYAAVRETLARLPPDDWLCGEQQSLNRRQAPRLLWAMKRAPSGVAINDGHSS
jgi:Putative rRNA methylase